MHPAVFGYGQEGTGLQRSAFKRFVMVDKVIGGKGLSAGDVCLTEKDGHVTYDHHVSDRAPDVGIVWSYELHPDGDTTVDFCLQFFGESGSVLSCTLYIAYSAMEDSWACGFSREENVPPSRKGEKLAKIAFGFKGDDEHDIDEARALSIVSALCSGYIAAMRQEAVRRTA